MKVEVVKKRRKLFFFHDRVIKIFDSGYLGYYEGKNLNELKALVPPSELKSIAFESGSKDKLKVITKSKSYLFKFSTQEAALDWYQTLNALKNSSIYRLNM